MTDAADQAAQDRFDLRHFAQEQITAWADVVLSVLALVMLGLLLVELADLAPPEWQNDVANAELAIWAVFVVAFIVELWVAPSKSRYLRTHWLVLLSLAVPFLRVFRLARAFRVIRATRALRAIALGRLLAALNRARGALAGFAQFSQFAYLTLLALVVTAASAGGVVYFERDTPGAEISGIGDALWWAGTLVTTVSTSTEMHSVEARVLAILLRLFGVSIIGYLTARLAAFLLRRDERGEANESSLNALHRELAGLRDDLRELREAVAERSQPPPRQ